MSFQIIHKHLTTHYTLNENTTYVSTKALTRRWIRGFDIALAASLESDGTTPGTRMGAALFSGNRLLSTGYNLYSKTRPGNTHKKDNGIIYNTSTHAEQMAIDGIKHYDYSNVKLILYVARVDKEGNYTVSRPCDICIATMRKHGINVVRFMNHSGQPEEILIK